MDVDLYRANPCMIAELRDELVGILPLDSDRPDYTSLGCTRRSVLRTGTQEILWRAVAVFEQGV